jgi:hypothetical protein
VRCLLGPFRQVKKRGGANHDSSAEGLIQPYFVDASPAVWAGEGQAGGELHAAFSTAACALHCLASLASSRALKRCEPRAAAKAIVAD